MARTDPKTRNAFQSSRNAVTTDVSKWTSVRQAHNAMHLTPPTVLAIVPSKLRYRNPIQRRFLEKNLQRLARTRWHLPCDPVAWYRQRPPTLRTCRSDDGSYTLNGAVPSASQYRESLEYQSQARDSVNRVRSLQALGTITSSAVFMIVSRSIKDVNAY